jgi:hypothetical protein
MTEAEWLTCQQPYTMLKFLLGRGKLTERKALLFAMACWRQVWQQLPEACRSAVEAAERAADGAGTAEEKACGLLLAEGPLGHAVAGQILAGRDTRWAFAPAPVLLDRGKLSERKLAAGIYQDRDFGSDRMGVLADALEEAGVSDGELLGHLRGPGLHVRGCFALDLLLGKA